MAYELDSIETVGVVGAGTMGSGIAQVSSMAGYDVVMQDQGQEPLEDGFETIERSLGRFAEEDRLSEDTVQEIHDRITGTTDIAELSACDIVVEAVVEDLEIKQEVFADLSDHTDPGTVLATNTNTLSITSIASATDRPAAVVGLHFMNPVPILRGVEVVVGEQTAAGVVTFAHEFAEDLGKITWEADDRPGFVTTRILIPWINEGIRAYDEGVATKADIDRGMTLGTNVPMGPLELADQMGLDVCLQACERLREELGERYRPAYLLKRKVEAGNLGKKTGEGFYTYG